MFHKVKLVIKLFLVLFLLSSLLWLPFTLLGSVKEAIEVGLNFALIILLLVSFHLFRISKDCPDLLNEDSLFPYTKAKIVVIENVADEKLKEIVFKALQEMPAIIIFHEGGFIEAETSFSWKSFGEKMMIQIKNGQVSVNSRCKIKTTLLDYGKNYQNTMFIINNLLLQPGVKHLDS